MSAEPVPERPLGPQEALFAELSRRANNAIQLVVIAELQQPVDAAVAKDRLSRVHQRHPMLRARMEDRDRLWWVCDVPYERIDIRSQPMGPDFDMEAFYAAEAATSLALDQASWRMVLLVDESGRVAWLALITNHAAVDGRSALVVLNDLDLLIADPTALDGASLPLMEPAEVGLAAGGISGEGGLLREWPAESTWAVERPAGSTERRPHAFLRVIPKSDLDALHQRMRGLGFTLAAAFCAAAAEAGGALPGHTDWTGILATTDVRADCRPPVPQEAVGEYVASISLLLDPQEGQASPIEIARVLNEQLKANRPPALKMDTELPPEVSKAQADALGASKERFPSGICVSDIGDIDRLSGRAVGISRILLMPSQNHGAHPVMVAITSTAYGVSLSFGYDEPLRSRDHAMAFADRYLDALASLSRG